MLTRKATVKDVPEMYEIFRKEANLQNAQGENLGPDFILQYVRGGGRNFFEGILAKILHKDSLIALIAVDEENNNTIAGFLLAELTPEDSVYIECYVIKPEYRRKISVNVALFKFLANLCISNDMPTINFSASVLNKETLSLAERMGFDKIDTTVMYGLNVSNVNMDFFDWAKSIAKTKNINLRTASKEESEKLLALLNRNSKEREESYTAEHAGQYINDSSFFTRIAEDETRKKAIAGFIIAQYLGDSVLIEDFFADLEYGQKLEDNYVAGLVLGSVIEMCKKRNIPKLDITISIKDDSALQELFKRIGFRRGNTLAMYTTYLGNEKEQKPNAKLKRILGIK